MQCNFPLIVPDLKDSDSNTIFEETKVNNAAGTEKDYSTFSYESSMKYGPPNIFTDKCDSIITYHCSIKQENGRQ